MNIVLNVGSPLNLVNSDSVYEFMNYCAVKDHFRLTNPGEKVVQIYDEKPNFRSFIGRQERLEDIDLEDVFSIVLPMQAPLFDSYLETGWGAVGDQKEYISFLARAKAEKVVIYYVLNSELAKDYEILKELDHLQPYLLMPMELSETLDVSRFSKSVIHTTWMKRIAQHLPYIPNGVKENCSIDYVTYDQVKDYTILQLLELDTLGYLCDGSIASKTIGIILGIANGAVTYTGYETLSASDCSRLRYSTMDRALIKEQILSEFHSC